GERRFWLVAEREERLLGAEPGARLRQRDDLVRRHRVRARLARIAAERAVPAVIATERGERHEHLFRERDDVSAPPIAPFGGAREQIVEPIERRLDEVSRLG